MSDPTRIQVPRWIELAGLPLALLLVWVLVGAVRHAVFLVTVAALVALLLDPLVRGFVRLRIPRGISIAIVNGTEVDGQTGPPPPELAVVPEPRRSAPGAAAARAAAAPEPPAAARR